MKSISFFLMAACCFLFTLGSCTDDDDSHAEATVSFMGMLTDLEFSIPSETDETDAGSAVPQITATKPSAGTYAKVVKFYTIPNGGLGVKYQIVSLG